MYVVPGQLRAVPLGRFFGCGAAGFQFRNNVFPDPVGTQLAGHIAVLVDLW